MYDAKNHYPLKSLAWSEARARRAIQQIVDDLVAQLAVDPVLPRHPMDAYGCKSDMYMGLSGVVWGAGYLRDEGAIAAGIDLSQRLGDLLPASRKEFESMSHPANSSYFFGEIFILMQQYKLQKDRGTADAIYKSIEVNNTQPVRELMWGTAGTMLCAHFMHQWTNEARWKDIYLFQAGRMLSEWEAIEGIGHLWSPDLYGSRTKYLGPVHGFAGNLIPLIEGREMLDRETWQAIASKAMETVVNTACSDDRHANWPAAYDPSPQAPAPRLLQHCHGAAGMVNALSKLPQGQNESFDRLLVKGGGLVWNAGPLKKGANLCHGTAGNGYALLKLHQRTRDELWIERARAFAMNCIDQYELAKEAFHQGRYTLWTGDMGTAVYLWDCIGGQPRFPTIDTL